MWIRDRPVKFRRLESDSSLFFPENRKFVIYDVRKSSSSSGHKFPHAIHRHYFR